MRADVPTLGKPGGPGSPQSGSGFYQTLLENMSEGVSVANEDGVIVYVNPAEERMFGYEPGELIGEHVSIQNAYPPEDNARIVADVMDQLRRRGAWQGEWLNKRKDGTHFVTSSRITAVDWNGQRHWLCVQEDITARKRAADELRDRELRLSLATDAADIGVWDWDLSTNTFEYSPRAREICGFAADQAITYEHVRAATHPEDYPHTSSLAQRALDPALRERCRYEYRVVRPDGEVRWVVAHGQAIFEKRDGKTIALRYVGTLQDITERKILEERDKAAARRLQLAMDAARMGVWEVDMRTERVTSSPELNRIFGFPDDAAPTVADIRARYAPEEKADALTAWSAAAQRGERFFTVRRRLMLPDGTRRWVQARAEIHDDASGQPEKVFGVVMDVTEIKDNEDRLAAIFTSDLMGLAIFDFTTEETLAVNDCFLKMTGHTREDFESGRWHWRDFTAPEYLALDAAAIAQAREKGWYDSYEKEYQRRDGDRIWVRISSAALPGDPGRVVVAVQDITQTRRAEEAERSFAERLRLAMEVGRLGAFDYDLQTQTMTWDAAQREIFGLSKREGPRNFNDVLSYVHEEDRETMRALTARAIADGAPYALDFRIRRPSGEIRWCTGCTAVSKSATGAVTRVFGYTIDTTAQRQAELDLAEREALLRSLLDAAELYVGVIELTEDSFRYLLTNKRTADFFGISLAEGPVDARDTAFTAEEVASMRASLVELCSGGKPRTLEYPFSVGGAVTAWHLGTYTPLPVAPGERPRVSFVIIDITERKIADERQALLMREVDHRAKNALAVVQAVVQLTREDEPTAFKKAVQGRVASIARAHGLLAADRWTGVNLHRLLDDELSAYRTERAGRLSLDGPPHSLPPSTAQSMALAFHELATNAAKYGALSRSEGDLSVRWSVDADGALELVWEERSAAFVPPAANRRGFGFTLLDQTITRQLRGRWSMSWEKAGLVCALWVPPPGSADASGEIPGRSAPGRRRRALIVEDEPLIALELEQYLSDLDFLVVGRCTTTREARRVWSEEASLDLALLDVNLGGETTFDLARELAAAGVPILFCTGYEEIGPPTELRGVTCLSKPVGREALSGALAAMRATAS